MQANNLIVTGASRFLNPINGVCTDGTTGTTKYMRQDGTWQVPPNSGGTVTSLTIKATSPISIDSSSAITTSGTRTLSHANSGVTAGTYQSVTVNATGHVTAGSALTKAQVTTALGYTPPTSDTNTHRPIQVNGTEILGNNTTVLNLKAGSNVSLTNSSGTVTIASTDTNNAVTQTATDSTDANYELLFSATADNTTRTEGARKSSGLLYNPNPSDRTLTLFSSTNNYLTCSTTANSCIVTARSLYTSQFQTILYNSSGTIVKSCTIGTSDIDLSGTSNTWDGTNTSLKDALAAKSTVSFTQSLSSGTKIGTITINNTATDLYCQTNTNTHRPIQVNGTQILGNNTTALNLKAGSNVSITNSSGTVTIAATDENVKQTATTYNNNYRVLFSYTDDATTKTEGVRRCDHFSFNPGTSALNIRGTADGQNVGLVLYTNGGVAFNPFNNDTQCGLYCSNGGGNIITRRHSDNLLTITGVTYSVSYAANFRSAIGAAASSSRLTKTNIKDLTETEAKKLLNVDVKSFDYKEAFINKEDTHRDRYYGVIAEEVMNEIPYVVNVPDDYDESKIDETKGLHQSLLTVDYDKFVPYLIKMIQIQQKEINELKEKYRIPEH